MAKKANITLCGFSFI